MCATLYNRLRVKYSYLFGPPEIKTGFYTESKLVSDAENLIGAPHDWQFVCILRPAVNALGDKDVGIAVLVGEKPLNGGKNKIQTY